MTQLLITILVGGGLVMITSLVHYEILRRAAAWIATTKWHPYWRAMAVVATVFAPHLIGITLYAAVYMVLVHHLGMGGFHATMGMGGLPDESFASLFYFSAAAYSSLGLGDIVPVGDFRILTAFEALNGLVLIGWSACFTYLVMNKCWEEHPKRK